MKLIVTADLHYDIARSVEPARAVAERIRGLRADGLLIVGDVAGREAGIVSECLHLFDGFGGRKFFVAGNHDLWVDPGENSLARLERQLPELCAEAGFHALDMEPAVLDGVGLVGSVGWYDYSFRAAWLEIPLRFYEHKVAPGIAARMSRYSHLVEDLSDVPESAMQIGTRWMDGEYVRMPLDDRQFCDRLLSRLGQHLEQVSRRCRRVIVGLHHLPFREQVPENPNPSWAFASAFMGSDAFGELLLAYPQVERVYTGHSHRGMCTRHGRLSCVNVGSTYLEKQYDIVEW